MVSSTQNCQRITPCILQAASEVYQELPYRIEEETQQAWGAKSHQRKCLVLDTEGKLCPRRSIRDMTNIDLAANYILKAKARIDILTLLMEKQDYSDVVREAQEIVELATKAML